LLLLILAQSVSLGGPVAIVAPERLIGSSTGEKKRLGIRGGMF
jgi:hypothetical protein